MNITGSLDKINSFCENSQKLLKIEYFYEYSQYSYQLIAVQNRPKFTKKNL